MTAPTARPTRRGLTVLAAVPAWLAVVAMFGAFMWSLVPLDNPGVQHCGAPLMFLYDGRTNGYPDANSQIRRPDGHVDTLTKAEVTRAFEHACSERVADHMVPAFVAFSAGAVLGLVTLLVSMVVWWRRSPPRPKRAAAVVEPVPA